MGCAHGLVSSGACLCTGQDVSLCPAKTDRGSRENGTVEASSQEAFDLDVPLTGCVILG